MKEDYASAAPTTAPNTSLGIKAGPVQVGNKKSKGGPQGSQRAPAETQIIMASYDPTIKEGMRPTGKDPGHKVGHVVSYTHNGDEHTGKVMNRGTTMSSVKHTGGEHHIWNHQVHRIHETLGAKASSSDFIHDFVHSVNPKFEGKSKKERIKMALGAYYQNESVSEMADTHTFHPDWKHLVHARGASKFKFHSASNRTTAETKSGKIVGVWNHKHREGHIFESQEFDSTDVHPKDFIHAGFGTKGGAGYHGHVDKVVGKMVHFTGSDTHIGMDGKPYKKTFKVPVGHVTVLHREGVIANMSELESVLEAHKKGIPLEGHSYHKKTDAELHHIMKDAGEASRLHDQMHKDPKIHPNKYADQVNDAATVLHYRRNGGQQIKESLTPINLTHKNYNEWKQHVTRLGGHDFHERKVEASKYVKAEHTTHVRRIVNGKPELVGSWNHLTHTGNTAPLKPLKEDVIYEAGSKSKMKRKYLGKTRGTTDTGKKAHEVVIDPILKVDPNRNNGRRGM